MFMKLLRYNKVIHGIKLMNKKLLMASQNAKIGDISKITK